MKGYVGSNMSTPREACWELLTESTKHRTLTIITPH